MFADNDSWTKLPKKNETFNSVITHLSSTDLPIVSRKYMGLYDQIVQRKLTSLRNAIDALRVRHTLQPTDALMSPEGPFDEAYVELNGLQSHIGQGSRGISLSPTGAFWN